MRVMSLNQFDCLPTFCNIFTTLKPFQECKILLTVTIRRPSGSQCPAVTSTVLCPSDFFFFLHGFAMALARDQPIE